MSDEELVLQKTANAAEESGDLEAALDVWRTLSSMDTNRPDYLCALGRLAMELERWAEAEQAFLDAIEVTSKLKAMLGTQESPELVDKTIWLAMVLLGSLFLKRTDGDYLANARKAKVWFAQSLALTLIDSTHSSDELAAPSSPPSWQKLVDSMTESTGRDINSIGLTLLGSAHIRLGEKEAAKKAFRKVIEIDDTYEEAYFNLGLLLADEGQNEEAEGLLRKAIQLDPDYQVAHGRLGILLQAQGRYSEADSELRRAIELDPADFIARRYLRRQPPL
jgi:tetratricopeptide (TPR) repeat protein